MTPRPLYHSSLLCLVAGALMTGLTSCSPSVSDMELRSANSRAEAAEARLVALDKEINLLIVERKQLTGFSGPDYERQVQRAEALRQEKAELEGIKEQVDGKVAHFTAETTRHREALAREKP